MTRHTVDAHHVAISRLEQPLFPEDGITKGDVLAYYMAIADTILPHMADRPLTLQRFPKGIAHRGFYQKSALSYFPQWIERVPIIKKEGGVTSMVLCNDSATLIYLVNQATITFHIWLSVTGELDYPDRLVIDLDPPDGGDFELVRETAFLIRQELEPMAVPLFLTTTGSRGLHLLTPLDRTAPFDRVRSFARELASAIAAKYPDRMTTEQRKEKRDNRVYLDIGRNAYGQTMVCPYSIRPLPGAPVATPISWDELKNSELHSQSYNISSIFQRLARGSDPWMHLNSFACPLDELQERFQGMKNPSHHR